MSLTVKSVIRVLAAQSREIYFSDPRSAANSSATAKTLLRQCCDTDLHQAQQLEIKSEYFG